MALHRWDVLEEGLSLGRDLFLGLGTLELGEVRLRVVGE